MNVEHSDEHLRLVAIQLRSRFQPEELGRVFYHIMTVPERDVHEVGRDWFMSVDTGHHKPPKTKVCSVCGQTIP